METLTANCDEGFVETDGTLGDMLRLMDRHGVEAAVLASIATKPTQAAPILQWSLQVRSPRVFPFGSAHPDSSTVAADVAAIRDAGLKGVKLHPLYQNFAVDDPRVFPLYDAIQQNDLVLLCHAGYDIGFGNVDLAAPQRFLAILDNFPKLRMVMAHLGGWKYYDRFLETICGRDVWIDTSFAAGYCTEAQRAAILSRHDSDRIVFASDSPWGGMSLQIEFVEGFPVSDELREKIFYHNAARLLGLDGREKRTQ